MSDATECRTCRGGNFFTTLWYGRGIVRVMLGGEEGMTCPTCGSAGRDEGTDRSQSPHQTPKRRTVTDLDEASIAVADVYAIIDAEKAKWMRCEHDEVADLLDAIRAAIEKATEMRNQ